MAVATTATRTALIDAATRAFADDGVLGASLVEITRQAGQRNRGAVHYHFGGRDGLLVAVLDEHAGFLAARQGELLAAARTTPDDDLAAVIEAVVRPAVELAEAGWRGRCYLAILGELVEQDPATQGEQVAAALVRTGGYEVYELLARRMPALADDLLTELLALLTSFVLGSVARRARAVETPGGRPQLAADRFAAHLVVLTSALASARTIDT